MPARLSFAVMIAWLAGTGLVAAQASKLLAPPTPPQPPGAKPPAVVNGFPSPLELVRGLWESGMADLAVEYLREIENRTLSDDDRKAIPLERARYLLDAAEEEPDEGARTSMIGEAKEAFNDFL